MRILLALALLVLTATPAAAVDGCEPEPASQWAPAGWICPPHYGVGTASTWQGPGIAVNWCVYPWTDCGAIAIQSLETGVTIVVVPSMWCHCYTGTPGERIVDLDPAAVAALGLVPEYGLWPVQVWAVNAETGLALTLPNTATEATP